MQDLLRITCNAKRITFKLLYLTLHVTRYALYEQLFIKGQIGVDRVSMLFYNNNHVISEQKNYKGIA